MGGTGRRGETSWWEGGVERRCAPVSECGRGRVVEQLYRLRWRVEIFGKEKWF